jgi:ribose-phosphate pyrophosphokinase
MTTNSMSEIRLIAGRSNPELANLVSEKLEVELTKLKIVDFANTEIGVEINETVRKYDCYILQTGGTNPGKSINDYIVELTLLITACRLSSAKSITVIAPCFPYARSDKKDSPRVPITAAMIANIFKSLGATRIISLDLHSGQIQGFTDIPFDNFYCINFHIRNLKATIFKDLTQDQIDARFVLAAPDVGSAKCCESYAKKMSMKHILMHKHRSYDKANTVLDTLLIGIDGIVKDKTVIIVDDIIDTMGTMISAVEQLKSVGAKDVILVATHGIFSSPALERLNECEMITKVIVTNSLPQLENMKKSPKIEVVDVSKPLAEMIKRLQTGNESISQLFE